MPHFDAVLFDLDGVVVDNMALHREVWTDFARRHGLTPGVEEIRALDGRRAADILLALLGDRLTPAEILALSHERETLYRARLETATLAAVPGVEAFLARLAALGIPRVLATSAVPINVEAVLTRLGLLGVFDAVVTAADVTHGKPHPEAYLTAAARVGVLASRCLVIEDALPGLAAGVAAGATCLGIATSEPPAALMAAGAAFTAPHFEALPAGLLGLLESGTT